MNKKQMIFVGFLFYVAIFIMTLVLICIRQYDVPIELIALIALIVDVILIGIAGLLYFCVEVIPKLYDKLGD